MCIRLQQRTEMYMQRACMHTVTCVSHERLILSQAGAQSQEHMSGNRMPIGLTLMHTHAQPCIDAHFHVDV